ncbi:MAG: PIN domain-containing protein [Bacteroidota bacterium]
MMKVFLDTDVLMDFLTKRIPFDIDSMKIMEYGNRKEIQLHISSLCLSNVNYLIGRQEGKDNARQKVKALLNLLEVLSVDKSIVEKAAYSEFKDFEDGIQNYCAEENDIRILITRNVKDYTKSNLAIQTPKDFIANFENFK